LIENAKEWYLNQQTPVKINWPQFEERFLNRFFSQNIFIEANRTIGNVFLMHPLNTIWIMGAI